MLLTHRTSCGQGDTTMPANLNPSTLNWFEIPTTDLERARTFYETIFGIALKHDSTDRNDSMYIFPVDRDPARPAMTGALIHRPQQQPGPGGTVPYLNCNGILPEVFARIERAGGTVLMPLTPVPGGQGTFACITDTEGNTIGLHSA